LIKYRARSSSKARWLQKCKNWVESFKNLLQNHWARIGHIYMKGFRYNVDSELLTLWSQGVGWATIGKTIFTCVYVEPLSNYEMTHFPWSGSVSTVRHVQYKCTNGISIDPLNSEILFIASCAIVLKSSEASFLSVDFFLHFILLFTWLSIFAQTCLYTNICCWFRGYIDEKNDNTFFLLVCNYPSDRGCILYSPTPSSLFFWKVNKAWFITHKSTEIISVCNNLLEFCVMDSERLLLGCITDFRLEIHDSNCKV
jgi:hypothetical protein